EAAQRLRWPLGTVKARLAQARALLRAKLMRRGLGPSVALLGAVLEAEARASVPPALGTTAVRSALRLAIGGTRAAATLPASIVALTKGTLEAMLMVQINTVGIGLVAVLAFTTAAGVLAQSNRGDGSAPARQPGVSKAKEQLPAEGVPVVSEVK